MIGFKIDQTKNLFFDKPRVMDAADRGTIRSLGKWGAYVRAVARNSMKRPSAKQRKAGINTAPAGQPPFVHEGFLKKFLFFAYDPSTRSMVVGPARLNGKIGNAPEVLEHGGTNLVRVGTRRRFSTRTVHIRPHPYMQPAVDASKDKAPGYFRDSIK